MSERNRKPRVVDLEDMPETLPAGEPLYCDEEGYLWSEEDMKRRRDNGSGKGFTRITEADNS